MPLNSAIESTIRGLVADDLLDRPRRGAVRAVLRDARKYTAEVWRRVVLASLDSAPVEREEAIREAAGWAAEHLGWSTSGL